MENHDQFQVRGGFAVVPTWVITHPSTNAYAIAVYAVLASHRSIETSQCWCSIGKVAEILQVSAYTVRKGIATLEEIGAIRVQERRSADGGQASNIYTLYADCPARTEEASSPAIEVQPKPSAVEKHKAEVVTEMGAFYQFKDLYPKRLGGQNWSVVAKRLSKFKQSDLPLLMQATSNYALYCEESGRAGTDYVMQASTFVNADRWREYLDWKPTTLPSKKPLTALESATNLQRVLANALNGRGEKR